MISEIETKIIEILQAATIDDVGTDVVQGIDDVLLNFNEYESYPRIVVVCESVEPLNVQIGAVTKEYTVNITLLCLNADKNELVVQRDIIMERIELALRSNERLDNIASADGKEKVYSSHISTVRISKFGFENYFFGVVWFNFKVDTDRLVV